MLLRILAALRWVKLIQLAARLVPTVAAGMAFASLAERRVRA